MVDYYYEDKNQTMWFLFSISCCNILCRKLGKSHSSVTYWVLFLPLKEGAKGRHLIFKAAYLWYDALETWWDCWAESSRISFHDIFSSIGSKYISTIPSLMAKKLSEMIRIRRFFQDVGNTVFWHGGFCCHFRIWIPYDLVRFTM